MCEWKYYGGCIKITRLITQEFLGDDWFFFEWGKKQTLFSLILLAFLLSNSTM